MRDKKQSPINSKPLLKTSPTRQQAQAAVMWGNRRGVPHCCCSAEISVPPHQKVFETAFLPVYLYRPVTGRKQRGDPLKAERWGKRGTETWG